MIPAIKKIKLLLIGAFVLAFSGAALAALTTEELTKLKASGLGEDVILFMIENGYDNVDRIVKLKEAGFTDGAISSIIRNDLKGGSEATRPMLQPDETKQTQPVPKPVAEAPATMQTSAKVRIEQYLVVGEPIVLNSQEIQKATVSLLQGRRLKIEWDAGKGTSTLGNIHLNKPFASPLYWDLDKGDSLHSVNAKDNSFVLRTGRLHQGSPISSKAHHWVMYLTPSSPDLVKRISEILSE